MQTYPGFFSYIEGSISFIMGVNLRVTYNDTFKNDASMPEKGEKGHLQKLTR